VIVEAMREPGIVQTLTKDGTLPQISPSPAELKTFVADEIVRWGKIVERAGLAASE
jgi:tripartite-type tricarboxylate transporter receptor subunit TctC